MEYNTNNTTPPVEPTPPEVSTKPKLIPLDTPATAEKGGAMEKTKDFEAGTKVIDISAAERKKKKVNLVFGAVLLGLIIAISFLVVSPQFLKTSLVENADATLRLEANPMTIHGVGGTSLVTIIMNTGSNPGAPANEHISTVTPYFFYPTDMFDVVEDDITPPASPSPYWDVWSVYRNQIDKTTGKVELSLSCDPDECPPANTDVVIGTFTVTARQLGSGTLYFDNAKSVLLLESNPNVLHETTPVTITVVEDVDTYCADASGNDGIYDSCSATGTGPACAVLADCTAIIGCSAINTCEPGGTGDTCTGDDDCQPVVNYCVDSAPADGLYDACSEVPTGTLMCSSVTECTTGMRCNTVLHTCEQGGVGNSCTSDDECAATIQYCEDTDGDNIFDSCSSDVGFARCDNQAPGYCETNDWSGCNMTDLTCEVRYNGPQCTGDDDCAALVRYCADTTGNGEYDSCSATTGDYRCDNHVPDYCQNLSVLGCNAANQCVQGGTGDACPTEGEPCPTTQNHCADAAGDDGIYDSCSATGTGPACSVLADCTAIIGCDANNMCVAGGTGTSCTDDDDCEAPPQNQCADTDSDGEYDSCTATGTGPSCTTDTECQNITTLGCNADDQCVAAGALGTCADNDDCTAPPQNHCADAAGDDGIYDSCSATGTGPACSVLADCTAIIGCDANNMCAAGGTGDTCTTVGEACPTTQNYCADVSGDGEYDSCTATGTGPSCTTDTECQNITTLGCNADDQCVAAGALGTCQDNADCEAPTRHCDDLNRDGTYDACSLTGTGSIVCTQDTDCITGNRCNPYNQTCIVGGIGSNCANDDQCALGRCGDSNRDGVYDRCLENGTGPYCNADTDCTGITARGCNRSNQCVPGGTGRSCTRSSDCGGGGGGSLFRCYDPNGGTNYTACNNLGQGPYCFNLSECPTNGNTNSGNENTNGGGGPVVCATPLTLSGTTSGTSVTLTWTLASDPNITGINVYYGTSPGSLTSVMHLGRVNTTTITGLVEGQTYYFVVTATGTCIESNYSNMVGITVGTGVLPGPFNPPTTSPVLPQTGAGIGIALAGVGLYWLRRKMKK